GGAGGTVVEHWDGQQWSIIPSPNVEGEGSGFSAISAIASSDVWAVGDSCCGNQGLTTLVEHWDGQQWSIVPSPNPTTNNNYLHAAAAVSSSDVWAVGDSQAGGGPFLTLTEHYALPAGCTTPTSSPTTMATLSPTATHTQIYTLTPTGTGTNTPTTAATPTAMITATGTATRTANPIVTATATPSP